MGDSKKVVETVSTGGLNLVYDQLTETQKPQALPKAEAPVTMEDPNVRALAEAKRRKLQGSRSKSRVLSPTQSRTTLG